MIELEANPELLDYYQIGTLGSLDDENLPRNWRMLTIDFALGEVWWTSEGPWEDTLTEWLRFD